MQVQVWQSWESRLAGIAVVFMLLKVKEWKTTEHIVIGKEGKTTEMR